MVENYKKSEYYGKDFFSSFLVSLSIGFLFLLLHMGMFTFTFTFCVSPFLDTYIFISMPLLCIHK